MTGVKQDRLPSAPDAPSPESNGSGVGALLKASRLRCGEDIGDVARMLRIRRPYLEAIESGRFGELPGAAYVLGFIRAYAEHLGLDSDEVIRRYKNEIAGNTARNDLAFPSPVQERSVPGGAVLLIGAVVALVAYGSWYVTTSQERGVVELIPALSGRFAALVGTERPAERPAPPAAVAATPSPEVAATPDVPPAPATTEPAAAQPGATPVVPEPAPVVAAVSGSVAEKPAEAAAPPAAAAPVRAEPPARPPVVEAPKIEPKPDQASGEPVRTAAVAPPGETKPVAKTEAPPSEPPKVEPPKTEARKVEPPKPTPARAETEAKPKAEAKAEQKPAEPARPKAETKPAPQLAAVPTAPPSEDAAAGRLYGSATEPSRILVRAKVDSWIQIRDGASNQLLLTRLLRAGDGYRVPDREGLRLLTGNAGGIEILVDGQAVPAIGPAGAVRRHVALDVERLRAGRAVVEE
jgi:cytoskeleton protein RodZ